jgi:putative endonuclease
MMFYVYVIKSLKNGRFYTGSTNNINKRIEEHNSGKSEATKNIRPFEVCLIEEYKTRSEACKRERFFKTGKGREVRDTLITCKGA